MGFLKKNTIAIGKIIASRCKQFPVWEDKPGKKAKKSTCWIRIPTYNVKPPKTVDREAQEMDYPLFIQIFADSTAEALEALDYMIRCGQEEIDAGENRYFWLSSTKHTIRHRLTFEVDLRYNFRVRQEPEEDIL